MATYLWKTKFQLSRLENVLKTDEGKAFLGPDPNVADFGAGLLDMLSNEHTGLEQG